MYTQFKHKVTRSVYLPSELIDAIQQRANQDLSNFNQEVLRVLLREFLSINLH